MLPISSICIRADGLSLPLAQTLELHPWAPTTRDTYHRQSSDSFARFRRAFDSDVDAARRLGSVECYSCNVTKLDSELIGSRQHHQSVQ